MAKSLRVVGQVREQKSIRETKQGGSFRGSRWPAAIAKRSIMLMLETSAGLAFKSSLVKEFIY